MCKGDDEMMPLNDSHLTEICKSELNNIYEIPAAKTESYAHYKTENEDLNSLLLRINKNLNYYYSHMDKNFLTGRKMILAENCRDLIAIFKTYDILKEELSRLGFTFKFIEPYDVRYNELKNDLPSTCGVEKIELSPIKLERTSAIFIIKNKNNLKGIKNIIFGSSKKPDIYFDEMLDNKFTIANESQDDFLVYDREINQGVSMRELNEWYLEIYGAEPKLSSRLKKDLNEMEKEVISFYFKYINGDLSKPAIFPQVYLHYDPKTIKKIITDYNGKKRVNFQRMDFLILYNGKRVVIEIDGKEHFTQKGKDEYDIQKYSDQVAYDRKMKFLGYDIFRIGGKELYDNFEMVLTEFFDKLLVYLNY